MNRSRATVAAAAVTAAAALAASVLPGTAATAATAGSDPEVLSSSQLRTVLQHQHLPSTTLLPTTATSHPWNGAAWQNKPIHLRRHGYTEKEYTLSGTSNVYDWVPGSHYATRILGKGRYTTRMDVRRPTDMSTWSGKVVVEVINMSAGYDWTAVWSALWQRVLHDHDVYVGITSKPNVLPSLERFDARRYRDLSWANPVPAAQQRCGTLPGDPHYDPNLSKLYENGLVWDVLTQAGRLLKSRSAENPLGRPARQVVLSGESQSSTYLLNYYRWFTPAAQLRSGEPVYDGYFAETLVGIDNLEGLIAGDRLNQCADRLPADDPQVATFPRRSVPWIGINSGWDYPGVRDWTAPRDANTAHDKVRFWELAGSNHGWRWQYLYGDADKRDLLRAGFYDPATYDWKCGPNNPEVPFYMAEKAAYEHLGRWAGGGAPPPRAPRILTHRTSGTDKTVYDGLGNAMGGIRFPMVEAPVASFGPGQYALTGDCTDQIEPFSDRVLHELYPTRAIYLREYRRATKALWHDGYVLHGDVRRLLAKARQVERWSQGDSNP